MANKIFGWLIYMSSLFLENCIYSFWAMFQMYHQATVLEKDYN